MVEVAELPRTTLTGLGEALTAKFGATPVTVRDTVVVAVMFPEVPFTVIVYVPGAALEATVKVMAEDPLSAMGFVPKPTVTPVGLPLADKVMEELNPPLGVLVMVDCPELLCATVSEAALADRLKPGDDELPPARAVIRLVPFGLPQPVARSYPVVAE